jgi:hypothetical protein
MRIRSLAGAIIGALSLVLAGCAAGAAPVPGRSGHVVLLAYHGRAAAELDVVSGADRVTVGVGRRGGPLVSAFTPAGSSARPVVRDGRVIRVAIAGTGRRGPADLRIWLSPSVRWRLVFNGGANVLRLQLGAARLRRLSVVAGFGVIGMTLPVPAGPVTAVLAGGASTVHVSVPPGIPARLVLAGGAGTAIMSGHLYSGPAGGTVLTGPGWPDATSRYLIDAVAGLGSVSVSQR